MPERSTGQRSEPADGAALRSRARSGFRLGGLSPLVVADRLRDLSALIADVGGECWACGPTAAALHGFSDWKLEPPYHLVVLRGRFVDRVHHVIHTTTEMPLLDRVSVEHVPATSATRTLLDLSATETPDRLTRAIDDASRDGLTSDDFLFRELGAKRSRGRRGYSKLLDVLAGIDAGKGGHSWLEREFLGLLAAAVLPRPDTQQVIGKRKRKLIRVDCRFPGTALVVELLGYTYHRSLMQLQADAQRMNRMVLDGLVPLQFTFTDITREPADVIAMVAAALTADARRTLSAPDAHVGLGS